MDKQTAQAVLDAMTARVDAKVQEEKQEHAPSGTPEVVTPDEVARCAGFAEKGDGIQFPAGDYAGISYGDACKRVGVAPVANLKTPTLSKPKEADSFQAVTGELGQLEGVNRPLWQTRAAAFVAWATEHLINCPAQMDWLAARGIDVTAVRRYRLGYNPGEEGKNCIIRPREVWGLPTEIKENGKPKFLWLPRGIVIPQIIPGPDGSPVVHRVRIHRLDADRLVLIFKNKESKTHRVLEQCSRRSCKN